MEEDVKKEKKRFGDLEKEKKITIIKEQEKLTDIRRQAVIEKAESTRKVEDLKDLRVSELIREPGDARPALMAHINQLARRLRDVEEDLFGLDVEEKKFEEIAAGERLKVKAALPAE